MCVTSVEARRYGNFTTHTDAHRHFAARVEDLIRKDVEGFISTVAQEPAGASAGGQSGPPGPAV